MDASFVEGPLVGVFSVAHPNANWSGDVWDAKHQRTTGPECAMNGTQSWDKDGFRNVLQNVKSGNTVKGFAIGSQKFNRVRDALNASHAIVARDSNLTFA